MSGEVLNRFQQAVSRLGEAARPLLCTVGEQEMALAGEVRLRVGSPPALSFPAGLVYLDAPTVTETQMNEMLLSLCGGSIYSHQDEIASGYISLPGGHRAGVCGSAVLSNGKVSSVRDITSICLRIAREHAGCSAKIAEAVFDKGLCSVIIAGPPCSGKTTILRDLACRFAEEYRLRVVLVDERGELAPGSGRSDRLCDVLRGYPKAEGILQAVRTMSPDVIIFDELGGTDEVRAVASGVNAGVNVICSAHAGSLKEAADRPQIRELLGTRAFEKIVMLSGRNRPGAVESITSMEELYALACRDNDNSLLGSLRDKPAEPACSKKTSA